MSAEDAEKATESRGPLPRSSELSSRHGSDREHAPAAHRTLCISVELKRPMFHINTNLAEAKRERHLDKVSATSMRTAEVTICITLERLLDRSRQLPHVNFAQQSIETPSCSRDNKDGLWRGQMSGSPKASATASGRGNQPAGRSPESNRGCPGPSDIMRETARTLKPALSMSSRAKVRSQPRSRPRWGNGRSRAQWKTRRSDADLASLAP